MDRLPKAYAHVIRLRQKGLAHAEIAEEMRLPVESIGPLIRLAEAKLAATAANASAAESPPKAMPNES